MRYHFDKPDTFSSKWGCPYCCDHPVYYRCTLFAIREKGLAVIQQRFDPTYKTTHWDMIDEWLNDPIYTHPKFKEFFDKRAGYPDDNGVYPTVTVRQLMWALKMKPIKKEPWETVFDRREI